MTVLCGLHQTVDGGSRRVPLVILTAITSLVTMKMLETVTITPKVYSGTYGEAGTIR